MNGTFMCSLLCKYWGFHSTQDTFHRFDYLFSEFSEIFFVLTIHRTEKCRLATPWKKI